MPDPVTRLYVELFLFLHISLMVIKFDISQKFLTYI